MNKKKCCRFCCFPIFSSSTDRMGARLGKGKTGSSESLISLSENEIDLLLKNTSMSRDQIMDFHTNFLKDCPNGFLTKRDFVKMFKELHKEDEIKKLRCDKFCEYVFK
jgi:hypothetical protein